MAKWLGIIAVAVIGMIGLVYFVDNMKPSGINNNVNYFYRFSFVVNIMDGTTQQNNSVLSFVAYNPPSFVGNPTPAQLEQYIRESVVYLSEFEVYYGSGVWFDGLVYHNNSTGLITFTRGLGNIMTFTSFVVDILSYRMQVVAQ